MNLGDLIFRRLKRKTNAYQTLFAHQDAGPIREAGDYVLNDLATFCGHRKPSIRIGDGAIDPIATGVAEGRREVFLRILANLHVTDDQLYELAKRLEKDQTNE